jgi:glucokinase
MIDCNEAVNYIGVDIGGTNTVVGLVTADGAFLDKFSFSTDAHLSAEVFSRRLHQMVSAHFSAKESRPTAIGVGVPGGNHNTGFIESPENFNWGRINFEQLLAGRFQIPVKIMNDAAAAALGQLRFGTAREMEDFIHITIGTGLGCSLVAGGRLITGHNGLAGEFGHTGNEKGERICTCGRRGCLESWVSAGGVKKTVQELLQAGDVPSALCARLSGDFTAEQVTECAAGGDAVAVRAWKITGEVLGRNLATLVSVVNPGSIIFSGGLTAAGAFLFDPLKEALEENLLDMHRNTVELRISDSHINYAVLGAASLVMNG